MRILIGVFMMVVLYACASNTKHTAPVLPLKLYEVIPDEAEKKTLRGLLTKELITNDTAFDWYEKNTQYFKPNIDAVNAIKAKADQITLVIFTGTWCHDSQQLVPKYLKTLAAAGFPDSRLTLIGVDRDKTTLANLHTIFGITNVPTVIVLKAGIEVGRIVEYGKTALVDKELGDLIAEIK